MQVVVGSDATSNARWKMMLWNESKLDEMRADSIFTGLARSASHSAVVSGVVTSRITSAPAWSQNVVRQMSNA